MDCSLISGPVCSFYVSSDEFFSGILGEKLGLKVLNLFQKHTSAKLYASQPSSFYEYLLRWNLIFISSVVFFPATLIKNVKWQ